MRQELLYLEDEKTFGNIKEILSFLDARQMPLESMPKNGTRFYISILRRSRGPDAITEILTTPTQTKRSASGNSLRPSSRQTWIST
jgi:hypothetical protein